MGIQLNYIMICCLWLLTGVKNDRGAIRDYLLVYGGGQSCPKKKKYR